MTTTHTPESLLGREAVDLQGDKIGSVGQVYVNDATGRPDWVTINTGFFGLRESFAPLQGSSFDGENLVLPFDKEVVKSAPDIEDTSHLNADDQDALYSHYNRYMTTDSDLGRSVSSDTVGALPGSSGDVPTRSGTATETTAGDSMTRSEEQLKVGTERVETGRARLRKYVVTEQQSVTVPVSHEEVRLVREPITDENVEDLDGIEISEAEHEVVLHEERPVVETKTVPVERVRLATDTVTQDQKLTAEVRKEQVEVRDETGDAEWQQAGTGPARPDVDPEHR